MDRPASGGVTVAPRILFYSHDGTGLGHQRIVLPIAAALARRRPDSNLLALTGALPADDHPLPPNIDVVKLPAVPKRRLYERLPSPATAANSFKNVMFVREAIARATAEAFAPHLVVVDHAPAGLFRELAAALRTLDAARPRPTFVMLMRDITFGVTQTRDLWRGEGAFDLLDRIYDRILVYGDRAVFDPILEYDLSPAAAAKTRFCGYLRPPSPTRSPSEVRAALGTDERPLLVATVGGGADGSALLQTVLSALRDAGDDAPDAFVVTGPLLGAADRAAVAALAAGVPRATLLPFAPNLVDYLHAADVVVTMGGYNALCEVVAAGKRAVVVPRRPGPEEQLIRAERFRARGLVTLIHPDDLSPGALWAAIAAELRRGASPGRDLPFDGRERIVAELIAALASVDTRA